MAQHSVEQQARQNETIARQSQAVVEESRRLAETAKTLVEKDAEARRELVSAQRELQKELAQQQASVNAERDRLEEERRQLAQQRGRDPILAAAIQYGIGLLACLLPLLVCVFVLYRMTADNTDQMAMGELLVTELTADRPLVLPGPLLEQPLALEDHRPHNRAEDHGVPSPPPRKRRHKRRRPGIRGPGPC
jgi:hypothetical protein